MYEKVFNKIGSFYITKKIKETPFSTEDTEPEAIFTYNGKEYNTYEEAKKQSVFDAEYIENILNTYDPIDKLFTNDPPLLQLEVSETVDFNLQLVNILRHNKDSHILKDGVIVSLKAEPSPFTNIVCRDINKYIIDRKYDYSKNKFVYRLFEDAFSKYDEKNISPEALATIRDERDQESYQGCLDEIKRRILCHLKYKLGLGI